LPCINPPVVINGDGVNGQYYIELDEGIGPPDNGTLIVTDASGCIPENTEVVAFRGTEIEVSNPLTCSFTDNPITITLINQRQCDINKAFDEKLCSAVGGCPEFQPLPTLGTNWSNSAQTYAGPGEVSGVTGCIVRFRGFLERTFTKIENSCQSYQFLILAGTLPAALWPAYGKALSVNVTIKENDVPGQGSAIIVPALLTVLPTGVMAIRFYLDSRCVDDTNLKLLLSLDGLTYEIV
jgi:hypothetical protein